MKLVLFEMIAKDDATLESWFLEVITNTPMVKSL
jgi:hypothetical protein